MYFTIRTLIASLINPLPLLWILLMAVFVFYGVGKRKTARIFIVFSLVWFVFITTPFVPEALLLSLENQSEWHGLDSAVCHTDTSAGQPSHVLVLGSGYEADNRLSWNNQLSPSGIFRLNEGIRLYKLLPGSILITSGYRGNQQRAQAEVSALAAMELGLDSSRIFLNTEPWNTRDEARVYMERFGTSPRLFLVTDAAHMPRTLCHFRKAGMNPIPAPVNFRIRKNDVHPQITHYFPSSKNIYYMEILFHEYLGWMWAHLGGD